ncbi:lysylphosphatidylglycerol synthase domain-containing protein [Myxococcota bacterium]|nr:lysylphosphatidylglycerol synthase domain-containing protein [Myxococcota bacterium]
MTLRTGMQRVVPFAVSALALWVVFRNLDTSLVLDSLNWHVAAVMLPALLVFAVSTLGIEVVCILRMLQRPSPDFGIVLAARIKCASYLLGILHYALGVGALTVLLRRRAKVSLADAAGTVLLISSGDLLVVLGFAAVGMAVVGADAPLLGVFAAVFAAGGGGIALLRAPFSLGPLERVRALPFFASLRAVPPLRLLELLGLRVLFSCVLLGLSGSAFYAFGIPVEPSRLVVGMMIVAAVSALPIAVAGLGTGQAAFLATFRGLAEPEALLALSLTLSASMISVRVLMGLIFAREFSVQAIQEQGRVHADEQPQP